MTLGELLRNHYRLAWLDIEDAWALQSSNLASELPPAPVGTRLGLGGGQLTWASGVQPILNRQWEQPRLVSYSQPHPPPALNDADG
jgi:hypothetical protein